MDFRVSKTARRASAGLPFLATPPKKRGSFDIRVSTKDDRITDSGRVFKIELATTGSDALATALEELLELGNRSQLRR